MTGFAHEKNLGRFAGWPIILIVAGITPGLQSVWITGQDNGRLVTRIRSDSIRVA